MVDARELLRFVLASARQTLDRSPEQVGAVVGVSGRTVRRLEDREERARPRRSTLQTLAAFYGLDAGFVVRLAQWDELAGDELAAELAELSGGELDGAQDGELRSLALRLARGGPGAAGQLTGLAAGVPGGQDVPGLVNAFIGLDRRRQLLAMALLEELAGAQAAEGELES